MDSLRRECPSLEDDEPPSKVHIVTRNTPRALATTLRRVMSRRLHTAPPGLLDRYLERIIITQVIDMEDLLAFVRGLQSAGGTCIATEPAPEQEPAQETLSKRTLVAARESDEEEPLGKKLQPTEPVARIVAFARDGTPPHDVRSHNKAHGGAATARAASPDPLARDDGGGAQVPDQPTATPATPPEADPPAEPAWAAAATTAAAPPEMRQRPVASLVVVHSMGTLIASEYAKHRGSERFRRNVARLAASLRRLARNPDDGHPLVLLLNETAAPWPAVYDGAPVRATTHHKQQQRRPAYEDYFHPLVDISLLCSLVGRVEGPAGGSRAQSGWSTWEVVVVKDAVGVWPVRAEDTAAKASEERLERGGLKSRDARSGLVVMDRGHVCSVAREKDHLPL